MTMEITTFALADGADADAFLTADADLQRDMMINDPGLVRRTTARNGAAWAVVTLWASPEAADSAAARAETSEAGRAFAALVDSSTRRREVYEELGG